MMGKNKKKIWIDLDNSPHVPLFQPIIKELHNRGYSTIITARDCFQTCELADLFDMQYKKIGRHHGKNKFIKLMGLLYRALQLMPIILKEKPALAISHGSRAQLIAASVFRIPKVVMSDYEYARMLPLAHPDWLIVPEVMTGGEIRLNKKHILTYSGIKEDVYVPNFRPDQSIAQHIGLNGNELVIMVRPPATEAHYFTPKSEELFEAAMNYLIHTDHTRLVVLPRNEKQGEIIKKMWVDMIGSGKLIIPKDVVNGLDLIWYSDLVISGGGTMNREAAALGVPVYSIFRGKIGAVDRYLAETGRLVLIESPADLRSKIRLERRPKGEVTRVGETPALTQIVSAIEEIVQKC
jgi:hypothetical protein